VGRILNTVTGITDMTKAAVFVINVTRGVNLEVYERELEIPSPKVFLKGLRFMVQEYIMGGIMTKRPASDWINGWNSKIFDLV
jgi:hypothetical protein